MNKNFTKIFLLVIIVIAAVLRIWQIGVVPSSPDWDEAALGYNAYSIMETGKDEYGKSFPIVLRSFDDYKPALYAYLIIPFIKIFGLNIVSVRLPSVIFGIIAVLATYFLVAELFKKREMGSANLDKEMGNGKEKYHFSHRIPSSYIALLTSFLLAISPWHIQFSRIAFESSVGTAFNILGALFLLKSFKKPWYLFLSVISAAGSIYVYQSEKVFTPLLFFAIFLIFRKEILSLPKKYILSAVLLGALIIMPMFYYMVTDKASLARAQGVSIFSDQTSLLKENAERLIEDKKNGDFPGLILDNRRFLYAKTIVAGYMSHFDLNWLFIRGDIARHHAPSMGIMYLFELPFLLVGIYCFFFSNFGKKTKYFILAWFLIAPIPASVTSGVPHAIRTLNFLPIFQVFTAIGILVFVSSISNIKYQISNIKIKYLIFTMCFLFLIFNISYYLNQYFIQQNFFNSQEWQYGYKEAVEEVIKIQNKYDKIVISNNNPLDQSYMFFLFYLKYPPSIYQKENQYVSGGFRENHKYGKYEFRSIDWGKEVKSSKVLFIGRPDDFPSDSKVIKTIKYLDNKQAIKIVEG